MQLQRLLLLLLLLLLLRLVFAAAWLLPSALWLRCGRPALLLSAGLAGGDAAGLRLCQAAQHGLHRLLAGGPALARRALGRGQLQREELAPQVQRAHAAPNAHAQSRERRSVGAAARERRRWSVLRSLRGLT